MRAIKQTTLTLGILGMMMSIDGLETTAQAQRADAPYGHLVWYKMNDGSKFADGSSYKMFVTRSAVEANRLFQYYNSIHRYRAYRHDIPDAKTYNEWLRRNYNPRPLYTVGESVQVHWGNKWWSARVLRVSGNRYYIHYSGWGTEWDEWVGPSRIRKR